MAGGCSSASRSTTAADTGPRISISLIVSDVQMPLLSGLEVSKGVRAARWKIPVVLVTAYPSREVRESAQKLGARLLAKPLDLDAFERAVLEAVVPRETG